MTGIEIRVGDCRDLLASIEECSVQCVVTSPPYWGLRDYGVERQIGLEATPTAYLDTMVDVLERVYRVLRDDGVLWLNMGDCYVAAPQGNNNRNGSGLRDQGSKREGAPSFRRDRRSREDDPRRGAHGFKCKDLVGMPWRLALALQEKGWYLRQDVIWSKPNPMPESVRDRPTPSHEYLFLLSKSERYFYDSAAIREPVSGNAHSRGGGVNPKADLPSGWDTGPGNHRQRKGRYGLARELADKREGRDRRRVNLNRPDVPGRGPRVKQNASFWEAVTEFVDTRNARSVWTIPTQAYNDAHFATFPEELARRCILSGSRVGDLILDPFAGSGTVGKVAYRFRRRALLLELNSEYARMAQERVDAAVCEFATPLFEEKAGAK